MITVINLNSHLEALSNKYGYELFIENRSQNNNWEPCIRFRIDSNQDSFYLKISRSWKSTRVELFPEAFAIQVITFLCKEVLVHKNELVNLLNKSETTLSEYVLEVDNTNFEQLVNLEEGSHSLRFYLETMTSESSIEHGLLNEKEAGLLDLSISIIAEFFMEFYFF